MLIDLFRERKLIREKSLYGKYGHTQNYAYFVIDKKPQKQIP